MKEHRSLHLVTSSVPMSCSPRKGEIETLFRKKKKHGLPLAASHSNILGMYIPERRNSKSDGRSLMKEEI